MLTNIVDGKPLNKNLFARSTVGSKYISKFLIFNSLKKTFDLKISSLPDRDLFFESWIKQAKIYIEFKKNLYLMEQNV